MVRPDQERYERIKAFHDERWENDQRRANRFYVLHRSVEERFFAELFASPPDAAILEFGCGANAPVAIRLAEEGRDVTAFDLSPVAIERARARARERGIDSRVDFHVMNAERLTLPERSFDVVCGTGVLHQLDLRRGLQEVARVLKPKGRALFIEPMGHNPAINLYRRLTPSQHTGHETPLRVADIEQAHESFMSVNTEFFAFLSLIVLPVPPARRARRLVDWLDRTDRRLLSRVPALNPFAWFVLLDLREPRPAA